MNIWQSSTIREINELINQMEWVQGVIAHCFIMYPDRQNQDITLLQRIKETRENLVKPLEEIKKILNPHNEAVLSKKEHEEMMVKRCQELMKSGFKIEVNPGPDDNISYTYRREED
jgi:hypothetical protein